MKKKLLILSFFLFWGVTIVFAQSRIVTGKVTSEEDGSTLPGVNVLIKGTSTGVATDLDGSYSIEIADNNSVLVFSFIGYETKEIQVGTQTIINISLSSDLQQLSEVIVVGYGVQTKEALTGSVGLIEAAKIEGVNTATFENALQGTISGVQISSNDGAPGSNTQIRIRGIGSISSSSEPLYVVDGIPVVTGSVSQTDFGNGGRSSNVMTAFNPGDIASITVLKDAAATAIYGSRGANGVILITTKSGEAGKPKVSLKTSLGFNNPAMGNLIQPLNRDQYRELFYEGYINKGDNTAAIDTRYSNWYPEDANTNWMEEITRTGISQKYDLSASGGNESAQYYASVGYFDQQGHLIGNEFNRFSARVKIDMKFSEKVNVSNNVSVGKTDQQGVTDGTRWQAPLYNGILLAPTIPVYDNQGRFYGDHASFFMGGNNPVGHLSGDDSRELGQFRIMDNLVFNYDIIEGLKFRSAWSMDLISVNEFIFSNRRYGDGRNANGFAEVGSTSDQNWIGTQTVNYSKTFSDKHSFDVLIGYEAQKNYQETTYGYGENFPSEQLRTIASAASAYSASSTITESTFSSILSRLDYEYDGKYFASFSLRRDGSSRFGTDMRYGTFWSVGASWLLSEESFMANASLINLLKLRSSYGLTGNAGIGNFPSLGLYGFGYNYDGQPGSYPTNIANPMLSWESQENFNIGFDFGILDNKVTGTVEYFDRLSSDLILNRPVSLTSGFEDITENVGDMRNKGWEISIGATPVEQNDFSWDISTNITFLNNEITYLPEAFVNGTKRREEGRDYQEYWLYGWAGVDPANGDPLWYKDETKKETTNNINSAVRYYDGKSATPDLYGGISNTIKYKSFTFDFQFNYQFGNYVYDGAGWVYHGDGRFTPRSTSVYAFENRWQQPGDDALFPKFIWGGNKSSNTQNSSRYLYDGSYIRLRNVMLSYNLPTDLVSSLSLKSVRAYIRMNNFMTWARDKDLYFDPEQIVDGVANTVTPQVKTLTLGIDIGL